MLIFRKGTPWMLMFRSAGSAVKESCFESLFAALLTLILELTVPASYMTTLMVQPYPLLLFQYIAAMTLVFRTKIAYSRYWECATTSYEMGSRLGDAITEGITFDELINTNKRQYGEEGAVWLEKRRRFQALLLRRFSLMHALAMQYLRRDDCLKNLVASDGREPNVPLGAGAFGGMEQPTSRADPKWQQLEVLGGITESELASLENTPDRVGYIFAQICTSAHSGAVTAVWARTRQCSRASGRRYRTATSACGSRARSRTSPSRGRTRRPSPS